MAEAPAGKRLELYTPEWADLGRMHIFLKDKTFIRGFDSSASDEGAVFVHRASNPQQYGLFEVSSLKDGKEIPAKGFFISVFVDFECVPKSYAELEAFDTTDIEDPNEPRMLWASIDAQRKLGLAIPNEQDVQDFKRLYSELKKSIRT